MKIVSKSLERGVNSSISNVANSVKSSKTKIILSRLNRHSRLPPDYLTYRFSKNNLC